MMQYYIKTSILLLLTLIASIFIGHLLVVFMIDKIGHSKNTDNLGKWIGYIERGMIALFVFLGLIQVTVFIFATKAAVMGFRIRKDQDCAEQKIQAEYMLLGTMLSYKAALIIGLIGRAFRNII